MDRQKAAQTPAQGLFWRKPCGGVPSKQLEPTAAYRLGADTGGEWRSPRKVTEWDNPQWLFDPPEIMTWGGVISSRPGGSF
jgi:hypothetical protein